MKKIIDWTKRWSFLILVLAVGVGYLTFSDRWTVYAEPLGSLREWMQGENSDSVQQAVSGNDIWASAEGTVSDKESLISKEETVSGNDLTDGKVPMVSGGDADTTLPTETATVSGSDLMPELVYGSVEDDYFKDALFIGDSRTVGLYEYGDWKEVATFYASTGLTIYKLLDASIVEVEGQKEKISVEQALTERTFSKIYVMIGINEMGTGTVDSFMEKYLQVVEHLRELQPEAIIYLQGIMKVTTERSEKGDYITNEGIEERNARIAELADDETVFYLDVNQVLTDETGGMVSSYTFDGVHLKAQYVSLWKEFLKANAVQKLPLD